MLDRAIKKKPFNTIESRKSSIYRQSITNYRKVVLQKSCHRMPETRIDDMRFYNSHSRARARVSR